MEDTIIKAPPVLFRDKLIEISRQAREARKESVMYKNIENRVKHCCELAASSSKNCVYINDLNLYDFIHHFDRMYYDRDPNLLENILFSVVNDLGLDLSDGYITWMSKGT